MSHAVGLEWGPTGGAVLAAGADVVVVVDVLSFTTTLTLAVGRGITVLPHPWNDERAQAYADEQHARLAVGRLEARSGAGGLSLSPAAMASVSGITRLVLPSPNGSSICAALAATGATVVGACLLDRSAVAAWLAPQVAHGARVGVVPAGERWPDGSLRPAVEDLWGAGAVLAALEDLVPGVSMSPEARVAERAFRAVATGLADELAACVSGVELIDQGYAEDVALAATLDSSSVVPVLVAGEFVDRQTGRPADRQTGRPADRQTGRPATGPCPRGDQRAGLDREGGERTRVLPDDGGTHSRSWSVARRRDCR